MIAAEIGHTKLSGTGISLTAWSSSRMSDSMLKQRAAPSPQCSPYCAWREGLAAASCKGPAGGAASSPAAGAGAAEEAAEEAAEARSGAEEAEEAAAPGAGAEEAAEPEAKP
mmetsp:Transcript_41271/g.118280  ORF Transcript_41271/g.118280 Transcript_41271/m.118280 type:complete len:112 (-) Transcript_41271:31-366(-)